MIGQTRAVGRLSAFALVAAVALFPKGGVHARDEPLPRRYGQAGSSHVGLGFGLGFGSGGAVYAGSVEYGYFVVDGVAPGVELGISGGADVLTVGRAMAAVRILPLRTAGFDLLLVPRFGRLFISDHGDLWGGGGTVGVIVWTSARVGLQLAYDYLRLFPGSDCDDLTSRCELQRFGVGLVLGF